MPRIARGLADNFVYHVLNRGNNKEKVFRKEQDYNAFIDLMLEAKERCPIKIFAYCLMPNHFHIIAMPGKAEFLSKFMQWLMTSHVRRYHKHYKTSGHVWQGRFKSNVIEGEAYILECLNYIHNNPVRAKIVAESKDYLWSSYHVYNRDKNPLAEFIQIDKFIP